MEPTTNTQGNEAELIALEKEYWQAMQTNNLATALRLTGFPCMVSGPQGVSVVDRKSYEAMMGKPMYEIHSVELSDATVKFPSADVAIVAYRVTQELTVEGERIVVECADASTWLKQNGQWRCYSHSEAIIGDPFGRDREEAPSIH